MTGSPFDPHSFTPPSSTPHSFTPPPPPQLRGSRKPGRDTVRLPFGNPLKKADRHPAGGGRPEGDPRPAGRRSLLAAWQGASLLAKVAIPVLLGIACAVGIKVLFVETFEIPSTSMQPTLAAGDRVAVEKLSYLLGTPNRGDVIVFRAGPGWDDVAGEKFFVKRVLAVAGDEVRCCDDKGRILVNGSPQHERYLAHGPEEKFPTVVVPEGSVFVMGDNRADSYDSRYRGPVRLSDVVGRARLRIWPVDHLGLLGRD